MLLRSLSLALTLAALAFTRVAAAQQLPPTSDLRILAPDITALRLHIRRGRQTITLWQTTGFTLGPEPIPHAYDFGSPRGGRIVAIVPGGAFFTDDRGATWRSAQWDGVASAMTLAFDSTSDFGVAGGEQGSIWTTDDRGEHWQRRRSRETDLVTSIAIVGHAFAFVTMTGAVFISGDGGLNFETVVDWSGRSEVSFTRTDDSLEIVMSGTVLGRLTRDGYYQRLAIAPH